MGAADTVQSIAPLAGEKDQHQVCETSCVHKEGMQASRTAHAADNQFEKLPEGDKQDQMHSTAGEITQDNVAKEAAATRHLASNGDHFQSEAVILERLKQQALASVKSM